MMGRLTFVSVASACFALVVLATSVNAQHPNAQHPNAQHEVNAIQEQTPGLLERIMSDYVYPIRDYDWRGVVRRFLNGVMDYIAPDTKEPKAGFAHYGSQYHRQESGSKDDRGVTRVLGSLMANWVSSKANQILADSSNPGTISTGQPPKTVFIQTAEPEDYSVVVEKNPQSKQEKSTALTQVSPNARYFTLNSHVTPDVAAHSWTYLGLLIAYSVISIYGALIPLVKFPTEEEIREFEDVPVTHDHVPSLNFQIK